MKEPITELFVKVVRLEWDGSRWTLYPSITFENAGDAQVAALQFVENCPNGKSREANITTPLVSMRFETLP